MDNCGICLKPAQQLFETGQDGLFACFKCQPLVPEVSLGADSAAEQIISDSASEVTVESVPAELECVLCHKSYQTNAQLQNHLRNHRAERRFLCTYCNKAFSQSNNLRAHLRIHTNERPYKCSVCDKAFTQVTNLNNHMRLHTGERPFACPEPGCNKAYAQVTNLNQHRKRHQSGRPLEMNYTCSVCGQQFEQRNHMYNHRRSAHYDQAAPSPSAAARFPCKICEQTFNTEKRLIAHMAEHIADDDSSESRFPCVFSSCGATFESPREHTQHLLTKHQLKVLSLPRHEASVRGRPAKTMKLVDVDPLDIKNEISYDMQVKQLLPKLKVNSLFQ